MVITEPEDGLITNQSLLIIKGVTDPGAEVTIDGESVDVEVDGSFNHTYELSEGENTIVVVASDGRGNTGHYR